MNTIKHCLFIALFSMVGFLTSVAQDVLQNNADQSENAGYRVKTPKKTAEERAASLTDTLSSVVNLSADQYKQVLASNLKYISQKDALKKNYTGNPESVKDQMKVISKIRKSEIAAILNPEQSEKWKIWKQTRKENAKEKIQHFKESKSISAPAFDDVGDM